MKFSDNFQLSENKHFTAEGFLVCKNVPLARTGEQVYLPSEIPGIKAGENGYITVNRPPEEVFNEDAIASFDGKPLTFNHPSDFIDSQNYARLMKGVIANPRRGEGINSDLLIGDIIIYDKDTIDKVLNKEIREVSGGYSAEYELVSDGYVRQKDIRGNHVALVPRGRCGERCGINDKEPEMKDKKGSKDIGWLNRFSKLFKDNDGDIEAAMEGADNPDSDESEQQKMVRTIVEKLIMPLMDQVSALTAKVASLEKEEVKEDAEEAADDSGSGDESDASKSGDDASDSDDNKTEDAKSVYFGDKLEDTISRAEILMPGIKLNNRFADSIQVFDRVCSCQRQTLKASFSTANGNEVIKPLMPTKDADIDKLSPSQVKSIFLAASEIMRIKNNAARATNYTADATMSDLERIHKIENPVLRAQERDKHVKAFWSQPLFK